jgi:hypothetical protein
MKLINQSKWLAGLMILVLAVLIISGCPPAEQTPTDQPPTDGPLANQPPVIDSLTSKYRQVRADMLAPVECVASDPDEDELHYLWSATGGSIEGEGAVVDWVAPDIYDTYTITVTVTDGEGGQATETIDIKVACCPIESDELKY